MKIPYRYFRSLHIDFFTTTCMIRVPHVITILIAVIGASQLPLIGTLHADSASVTTWLEGMANHPALQSGSGRERYRQSYKSTKKWWDLVQTSRFPVVLSEVPVD